ncbi:MAG TPA: iron transporter, partial [Casimicrobiaceae bacterium]|nr:iron transporter [Casimicrobiaceae bacterium]
MLVRRFRDGRRACLTCLRAVGFVDPNRLAGFRRSALGGQVLRRARHWRRWLRRGGQSGFPDGTFVPYLDVHYEIAKEGSGEPIR